ncbi:helix-turn-helix domain-containing protein [Flavobacterium sp. WV_118_3]|uniref:AraC family transcriptional regulator n=1 Tax=Flavobacterium sp. WV_118_3 TaxID=3151764 RepID=UPI003219C66C
MTINSNIKALYKPIQPTIQPTSDGVSYREFLPDTRLSAYIYCYWQLKTNQKLQDEFSYQVVADGCMDIYFEPDNPSEAYISGFNAHCTEFPLGKTFHYIGIRFYPAMFPLLFQIDASELSYRYELLQLVLPEKANYFKMYFTPGQDTKTIKRQLDHYYLNRINRTVLQPDFRFFSAINNIFSKSGNLNLETELDAGISLRQLRRLSHYYLGDSTKTFCKVVRFQNAIRQHFDSNSPTDYSFLDYGYYDQAHFIREFKSMYGRTPKNAIKK